MPIRTSAGWVRPVTSLGSDTWLLILRHHGRHGVALIPTSGTPKTTRIDLAELDLRWTRVRVDVEPVAAAPFGAARPQAAGFVPGGGGHGVHADADRALLGHRPGHVPARKHLRQLRAGAVGTSVAAAARAGTAAARSRSTAPLSRAPSGSTPVSAASACHGRRCVCWSGPCRWAARSRSTPRYGAVDLLRDRIPRRLRRRRAGELQLAGAGRGSARVRQRPGADGRDAPVRASHVRGDGVRGRRWRRPANRT